MGGEGKGQERAERDGMEKAGGGKGQCKDWLIEHGLTSPPTQYTDDRDLLQGLGDIRPCMSGLLHHVERQGVKQPVTPSVTSNYSASQKKSPPAVFWHFFPNGREFFNQFLHTYYTFLSTLNYQFLFNYLQLWRSYAILSATTQRIFTFH